MKGTISEMELTVLRQRSQAALKQTAARGELFTTVAVGYVTTDDRLEKDPDARVQNAIGLVFQKFRELGSVRQVLLWFRDGYVTWDEYDQQVIANNANMKGIMVRGSVRRGAAGRSAQVR